MVNFDYEFIQDRISQQLGRRLENMRHDRVVVIAGAMQRMCRMPCKRGLRLDENERDVEPCFERDRPLGGYWCGLGYIDGDTCGKREGEEENRGQRERGRLRCGHA